MNTPIIFIGPAGGGKTPTNGASAKNFHLLRFLKNKDISVKLIDTEFWKKDPSVLCNLLWTILVHKQATYIIAANNKSSNRIIKILQKIGISNIIYWVIGGSIAEHIIEGRYNVYPYRKLTHILAEGKSMVENFQKLGCSNAIYVPNFKNIDYLPKIASLNKHNKIVRFIFLSRIIPQKGCDLIINAVKELNYKLEDKFEIDFYGPIEEIYKETFLSATNALSNINYKGFIDLRNSKNYDILKEYDAMLFPTFWDGEGFPGVIIDALISGLPVIASRHNLNADLIEDNVNGFLIEAKDEVSLKNIMKKIIEEPTMVRSMKQSCQKIANEFSTENVITDSLLKKIGLL